jgi:phosphopantetheinyl transferase
MPFTCTITAPFGSIGIWELSDSAEALLNCVELTNSDQKKYATFKAERRKKEFLASRILLQKLHSTACEITYNNEGKPFLKDSNKHISISHSADFACVYISDKNNGIDVEQISRNIDRVAQRFLHPQEQAFVAESSKPQEAKILLWAAKEAIFKCTPHQSIEFNEQILIDKFEVNEEGKFEGSLLVKTKKVNFQLHYRIFKNNAFVYCVEE